MVAFSSASPVAEGDSMVSFRVVKEIAAALERAGVARERFVAATGFEPALFDAPDGRVSRRELVACLEAAFDLTGDPAFGIHWAESFTASSWALMSQLLSQAATLRQALAMLLLFGQLISDEIPIALVERGELAELRFHEPPGASLRMRRIACEMTLLGLFRMLRDFRPSAKLVHASFAYPAPEYRAEYTRAFEGVEQFDQPCTCLVIAREVLDQPSRHHDPETQVQLQALAERRVQELREQVRYELRVRELLARESAPHRVAMNTVAQQLDMSLRSLHRRLAQEGRSYTAIVNEASAIVAKRLLTEERRTIQEVSFAMGFSSVSSFHRAFKRWTGTTPTQFRARR